MKQHFHDIVASICPFIWKWFAWRVNGFLSLVYLIVLYYIRGQSITYLWHTHNCACRHCPCATTYPPLIIHFFKRDYLHIYGVSMNIQTHTFHVKPWILLIILFGVTSLTCSWHIHEHWYPNHIPCVTMFITFQSMFTMHSPNTLWHIHYIHWIQGGEGGVACVEWATYSPFTKINDKNLIILRGCLLFSHLKNEF